MEHMLNLKGRDRLSPCHSCNIHSVCNISAQGKTYYVPLCTPDLAHQTQPSVQPKALDLHTHHQFLKTINQLDSVKNPTQTKKQHPQIAKESRIWGPSALWWIGSLNYAWCMPWKWMHLFLENVVPTLVDHWTGCFKGLDSGVENYEIVTLGPGRYRCRLDCS